MSYRVRGLDPAQFCHLYGLSADILAAQGAERMTVDAHPGYPDRVELRDLEPGETVLLLNYVHQPAHTPYRASHAIFVREGAARAFDKIGEIPAPLRMRPISLRAFDAAHRMVDADLAQGSDLEPLIRRFLADSKVDYLHAHYAERGCYAARVERA